MRRKDSAKSRGFIPPHGGYETLLSYRKYRDFLRPRGQALWDKDSKEALFVRKLGAKVEFVV
jgi:hypothetical protein